MKVQEMHYDFKKKLNKVDSEQNRNLLVPEIDWALNEAQEILVKTIAEPRQRNNFGVEKSQRNIDDISVLTKQATIEITDSKASLPTDYMFFLKADVSYSSTNCPTLVTSRVFMRRHDTNFEESLFDKSSFEWRMVNGMFISKAIQLFAEGMILDKLVLSYIKKPRLIHSASSFAATGYKLPGSTTALTGTQDCELPEHLHREVVDLAVAITSGDLQSPDFTTKVGKLSFNELK